MSRTNQPTSPPGFQDVKIVGVEKPAKKDFDGLHIILRLPLAGTPGGSWAYHFNKANKDRRATQTGITDPETKADLGVVTFRCLPTDDIQGIIDRLKPDVEVANKAVHAMEAAQHQDEQNIQDILDKLTF